MILRFLSLLLLASLTAHAADVAISGLPLKTSPSTNTFIEIADMNGGAVKSGKYLLTNLASVSGVYALTNGIIATATNSAKAWSDGLTNTTVAMATNSAKSYADTQLAGKQPTSAITNYFLAPGTNIVASTNIVGTNVTWTVNGLPTPVWNRIGVVMSSGGTGDANSVYEPSILVEGSPQILTTVTNNTVFKMWYTSGWGTHHTMYAESVDGLNWVRYSGNPVLDNTHRNCIVKVGATYHLFVANNGSTSIDRYTSANGLTWTIATTNAIVLGSAGQWDASAVANSSVYIEAGTWYMLYDGSKTGVGESIGLATSPDGATWTKYAGNPVITGLNEGAPSNIQKVGTNYWVWVLGSQAGTRVLPTDLYRWKSVDLTNWVTSPSSIVFQRRAEDEGAGNPNGQVSDPWVVSVGGLTYLYYAASSDGSNQSGRQLIKVAIANMPLSDVVNTSEGDFQIQLAKPTDGTMRSDIVWPEDGVYSVGNLDGTGRPSLVFAKNTLATGGGLYIHGIGTRCFMDASADGVLYMFDSTAAGWNRICLGGLTASYPALKRNGAALQSRLADDSASANFIANTNFVNELMVTNGITLGGVRNTAWPAGGSGNMVNSGASAVNDVPVYTDVSGTALTPTNTLFLTGLSVTNRVPFYSGIFVPNATNIVSRNGVNSADVPLIGIDTNDVVQVSDATHDTTLNGQYVHVPGRLLAGSGVFTNTLNVSNLTVTASGDFNEMNAGTLFLSNMVANVVPVFDGNTNLVPSTTTTNDLLSLHNMFTTTGATVAGPILTTTPTTNGPSTLELATAGWVRSLLNNGTFLYNSTNVVGTAFDASTYLYVANQPTNGSRSYTPAAGDYIGSVMTTQRFEQVSGPVHIASWFTSSGGASSAQYTLHPEIYYTYDTNSPTLLGDYTSAPQAITHGAITNEYDFVVSFPTIINTNTPGNGFYLVRRFKIDTKTGTDTLKLSLGTNGVNNTPAHIDFTQPAVAGANWVASGTTNSTLAGDAQPYSVTMGGTNVIGAIAGKAPLASPALTGAPTLNGVGIPQPVSALTTTWTAANSGSNYVADLTLKGMLFNMTTNLNIIHSTNGTANFTANTITNWTSIRVINNSGTNFPVSWPATWHTVGTVASAFTLTNGDFCSIAIEFAGPTTDQTNNWIGVAYKQY